MNNISKNKGNSIYENISYVDIVRYNLKKNDENHILNEPNIWKNKIELRRILKCKEHEKITLKKNEKNNNYENIELNESCNRCFLRRRIEREEETKNVSRKLDIFNKSVLFEMVTNLWDTLNVEKENSIDLFNDKIYNDLTDKEKKNFQNYLLPHFVSYAKNINEIKNGVFEKNINLKDKSDKNISELKRIANENNLCLLIHNNKERGLSEEKHMLITAKSAFFKIMREIIINEKLFDANNDNVILKTIVQISENKKRNLNMKEVFFLKDSHLDNNSNSYIKKPNDLNKIYYSIKGDFPKRKKYNPLLKEDYEVIEKENIVNDLIHNSIMQLSKNSRIKDSLEDNENNTSLLKYKNTTKKNKKFSQIYKNKEVYDPLRILKEFLEKDSNILDYKDFLNELRACTFQPNIHKYIEGKNKTYMKNSEVKEKKEEEIQKLFKNDSSIISNQLYKYIYKAINDPYNNIKNMSNMKYLKLYNLYYNNNMEKNSKNKIKHYDNPRHRTSKQSFRTVNNCNISDTKRKEEKKNIICKNAWENGLRGGYISSHFNFSLSDQNEKEYESKKNYRIKQVDWGENIRLNERRLKTEVIPNLDLVNKIIESMNTYIEEPPTIIRKKKFFSKCNDVNEDNKNALEHNKNGNNTNNSLKEETIFKVTTPIKTYKYNRSVRIKNALENFGKSTSFAPPKVIAVKSDNILEDIRQELLSLPESVYFIDKLNLYRKKN